MVRLVTAPLCEWRLHHLLCKLGRSNVQYLYWIDEVATVNKYKKKKLYPGHLITNSIYSTLSSVFVFGVHEKKSNQFIADFETIVKEMERNEMKEVNSYRNMKWIVRATRETETERNVLDRWKNEYERIPNRVNVIFRSLNSGTFSVDASKMQFDINICDTHVPHWRKQWVKNGKHLFLLLHQLFTFLICFFPLLRSLALFQCDMQTISMLAIGWKTFRWNIFTSLFERFYCIKINRKVHYDFPRALNAPLFHTAVNNAKEKWRVLHK